MIPPERIGRYRLGIEIGRGAMGAVFRAHDPLLEREVAVKLISLALAAGHGDPKEAAARFAREARVAARLQHPNVVAVYDFGEEGDQLFLVMELVAGETLGQRLARGDFPGTTQALEIVARTADALAAAHLAGVIHRDIKPGNLLLPQSGGLKVSDFGVARAVGEATELTRTGMMVGSPAYMAPEQVQGMELDGRSDLFSLGVVLYEMLMHRKPFPADTLTTLVYQILHQDPFESETVAGRLHPDLVDLLRWSLAKERDVRIPDAVTFANRARALAAQFARGGTTVPKAPARAIPTPLVPGLGTQTTQDAVLPRPLPAASYATSAPTEIVRRSHFEWRRWLPWSVGALLAAALVGGLLLRSPAPPPDLAKPSGDPAAASATSAAPAAEPAGTAAEPAVAPRPDAADAAPADTPAATFGQRVEQQAAPAVPAKSANLRPATLAPAAPAADSVPAVAPEPAPEPVPAKAAEPSPPISEVFQCRRGAEFRVDPEELLVTIDGKPLGIADDWDGAGGGKAYIFPGPGDYLIQLSLKGYRTEWVRVVVTPSAKRDIVKVDTELDEVD